MKKCRASLKIRRMIQIPERECAIEDGAHWVRAIALLAALACQALGRVNSEASLIHIKKDNDAVDDKQIRFFYFYFSLILLVLFLFIY